VPNQQRAAVAAQQKKNLGIARPSDAVVVVIVLGFAALLGFLVGMGSNLWLIPILAIGLFGATIMLIQRPYIGMAFVAASLVIYQALPDIPHLESMVPFWGAATVGAYILHDRWKAAVVAEERRKGIRIDPLFVVAMWMLIWILISVVTHGSADESPVSSAFTFIQLFVLLWLGGRIFENEEQHLVFFLIFGGLVTISAVTAITQVMGANADSFIRAYGLAGGANKATRYFTVAYVVLLFLFFQRERHRLPRWIGVLIAAGIVLDIGGVIATASRSGLALIVLATIALGALTLLGQRKGALSSRTLIGVIAIVCIVGLGTIALLPSALVQNLDTRISRTSESDDTITTDVRIGFWRGGFDMWIDHPIDGVGVNLFDHYLPIYGVPYLPPAYLHYTAHNSYVTMLSETGIVGFLLFIAMHIIALRWYWQALKSENTQLTAYAALWMTILLIIMVGGITKQDNYERLLWLSLGVSYYFHVRTKRAALTAPAIPELEQTR